MRRGCNRRQIRNSAEDIGVLHHDAAGRFIDRCDQPCAVGVSLQPGRAVIDAVAGKFSHRLHGRDIVWVQAAAQHRAAALGHAARHRHGFPARGRAIVHRGIGDIGAEQPRDLRLEFEQHLQCALRDFGLVRGVRGEKLAALDQVIDAGGNVVAISPGPKEERHRSGADILRRQRRHVPLDRHLAGVVRQARDGRGQPRCGGNIGKQVINVVHADHGQHVGAVSGCKRQIAHRCYSPATYAS